jgi:hypothetical protein
MNYKSLTSIRLELDLIRTEKLYNENIGDLFTRAGLLLRGIIAKNELNLGCVIEWIRRHAKAER